MYFHRDHSYLGESEEYSCPWAGLPAAMRGSPLLLCLFSASCWVNLTPTAGDKIFHFGACRVSMSMAEIRAGFTAIKADIVSIPRLLGGLELLEPLWSSLPIPISSPQQSRDPIRTLSILSHPHSLHKLKVGGLAGDPKAGWCHLGDSNLSSISHFQLSHTAKLWGHCSCLTFDIQLQIQLVLVPETR